MAKDLDVQLQRIPVMVANMTIIGMNVLHAAAGGRLPVYQYGVDEPNIAQGNPQLSDLKNKNVSSYPLGQSVSPVMLAIYHWCALLILSWMLSLCIHVHVIGSIPDTLVLKSLSG